MQDISLISKAQKEQGIPRLGSFKKAGPGLTPLVKIALSLAVVVIFVGSGLFAWERILISKTQKLEDERKAIVAERDAALESRAKTLGSLITAYQELVSQHLNWSRLFGLLAEKTLPDIRFKNFSGTYVMNTFELNGFAPNYKTLAQQLKAFESSSHLGQITVGNVTLGEEGEIEFAFTTQFKNNIVTGTPSDLGAPDKTQSTGTSTDAL